MLFSVFYKVSRWGDRHVKQAENNVLIIHVMYHKSRLPNCVMGLRLGPRLNVGKLIFVGVYAVSEQHFF